MRRLSVLAAALGLAQLSGCAGSMTPYTCSNAAQCDRGGEHGVCETTGYCSYADPACDSGRRYGTLSSTTAGQCVPPSVAGAGPGFTDSGGSGASDGGPGTNPFPDGGPADQALSDSSGPRDRGATPDGCACLPGTPETGAPQTCGECSTQRPTRTCGANCQWDAWVPGACVSSCPATPPACGGGACRGAACDTSTGCQWDCVKTGCEPGVTRCCTPKAGGKGVKTCGSTCTFSGCVAASSC
ncbi:MAG: hypothetical protein IT371_07485 [Deltaproteobacteria bacterium]|nr:hypothetical protein [Deltaproteobacteria bacterium]